MRCSSMASPGERDDLMMLRTLGDVADSHVAKHERQLVTGVLEHQLHPPLASWAVGVLDILDPTGPARELVGPVAPVPVIEGGCRGDPFRDQADLATLDPHPLAFLIKTEDEPEFFQFGPPGIVVDAVPADDRLGREGSHLRGNLRAATGGVWMDDAHE